MPVYDLPAIDRLLAAMKLIFANENPIEYRYDDEADVLYSS